MIQRRASASPSGYSNAPSQRSRGRRTGRLRRVSFFGKLVGLTARAFGVEAAQHIGYEHGVGLLVEVTIPRELLRHLLGRTLAHLGIGAEGFSQGRKDPVRVGAHLYVATGHLASSGSSHLTYSSSAAAPRRSETARGGAFEDVEVVRVSLGEL